MKTKGGNDRERERERVHAQWAGVVDILDRVARIYSLETKEGARASHMDIGGKRVPQ